VVFLGRLERGRHVPLHDGRLGLGRRLGEGSSLSSLRKEDAELSQRRGDSSPRYQKVTNENSSDAAIPDDRGPMEVQLAHDVASADGHSVRHAMRPGRALSHGHSARKQRWRGA
jgi:hypothetical protein